MKNFEFGERSTFQEQRGAEKDEITFVGAKHTKIILMLDFLSQGPNTSNWYGCKSVNRCFFDRKTFPPGCVSGIFTTSKDVFMQQKNSLCYVSREFLGIRFYQLFQTHIEESSLLCPLQCFLTVRISSVSDNHEVSAKRGHFCCGLCL